MSKATVPLLIVSLMLAACGSEERAATPTAAAVPPPEPATEPNVVLLDQQAQQDTGVVVGEVEVRSLPEVIRATGRITINENETWRVGAVTDGRIVYLYVKEGDQV